MASGQKKGAKYFALLSLGALGVVYGDIGTSPLYAIRECFSELHGIEPTPANILGVLSLVFWSLVLIISVKYLMFVLRADNQGEGGILALLSLVHPQEGGKKSGLFIIAIALFAAALLYGDGMITPAISVLSAVEGLELAEPHFHPFVIPLTVAILIGFFLIQRRGTATVGALFGPVTAIWFLTLAVLGVRSIVASPEVLAALNPYYALSFLLRNEVVGFFTLGAVFLVVTGGEALYADMGHFGRRPIRVTWFSFVLPALLLNYFGQGALLLRDATAIDNPFYRLAPEWALVPLIVLATFATIIASQAMLSGAFSITMQAVQLGLWPRLEIRHTSAREFGQIYVPPVNYGIMVASIFLVLTFRSSSGLAAAYGMALSTTMVITTSLLLILAWRRWKWNPIAVALLAVAFLGLELSFFVANVIKIPQGGWFPLVVAAGIFIMMVTWRDGRRILADRLREHSKPLDKFLEEIPRRGYARVKGNAVYMTGNAKYAPPALVKNLEHNRTLHFQVVLLTIETQDRPHVDPTQRIATVAPLGNGFYRVVARYGFMEEPNALEVLVLLREKDLDLALPETTFFLGRERLISTARPGMARWREQLFGFMARNAQQPTAYFRIPPDRVIEVGSQVEI